MIADNTGMPCFPGKKGYSTFSVFSTEHYVYRNCMPMPRILLILQYIHITRGMWFTLHILPAAYHIK